jgi:phosphocarrier protein HPr
MKAERVVEVVNTRGLHARAAAKFVQEAERHAATVTVRKDDLEAGALSIMGLLMLSASKSSRLVLVAEGEGADKALDHLARLVETGFGEEG